MVRVKRGVISNKTRKNTLKKTKGYRFGRSTKEREAKVAIVKAGVNAFTHRRDKKNDFRLLWQTKIGAGLKAKDLSYSKFMGMLKTKGIVLNRKVLAEMAAENPESFTRLVKEVTA